MADTPIAEHDLNHRGLEIARLGVWSFDPASGQWLLSSIARRIFGLPPGGPAERQDVLASLTPIDKLRVETAWNKLIHERAHYEIEYQIVKRNGASCWIWEKAELERDAAGEPARIVGAIQDISARRSAEQELHYRANHDALTGLPNRAMLDQYLQNCHALARRRNERMALMVIDLDRFKEVNDTYGHAVGDQVLKAAALRMRACLRGSDMIARQGGDEFIAVLLDIDLDATVGVAALRLIEEVSKPYNIGGVDISIGASVGIALLPEDGPDISTIINRADSALYSAKQSGRETLCFFEKDS